MKLKAASFDYSIICQAFGAGLAYPYFRSDGGDKIITCISPHHGRSFVIKKNGNGQYIVSKGNGLSYTQYNFLHTGEFGSNTWGVLSKKDAIRDFTLGQEVASLGIKTNKMEYVLELQKTVILEDGHTIRPVLLQYSVECPYRICDAPFMTFQMIKEEIDKWSRFNCKKYDEPYMIAADVLIGYLRKLHDNNILHNAIHVQNFTWALELLDFELACSPKHPYDKETDNMYAKDLFQREILYTYEVINYIAWCLNSNVEYKAVDAIFKDYGFDLNKLSLKSDF